jgi:hypothetical protein
MLAREPFDGPHVWDKPGLSGYLVCLVHLVSLMQSNKSDRPNRPEEQDRLADFFSILLGGFLRFVEHKVHNDNHSGPKQYLLVPEEDFPIVIEDTCEQEGAADEAVAEGQVFNNRIRPYGNPTEINQEGNDVDLESPADREEHIEEADENESGAHDHPGDTHLVVAPGAVIWLAAHRLVWWFWRHGQLVPKGVYVLMHDLCGCTLLWVLTQAGLVVRRS